MKASNCLLGYKAGKTDNDVVNTHFYQSALTRDWDLGRRSFVCVCGRGLLLGLSKMCWVSFSEDIMIRYCTMCAEK